MFRDLWFICAGIMGHESSDSQPEISVGVHKTINVSYSMFIDNMGVTHVPNSDYYLGVWVMVYPWYIPFSDTLDVLDKTHTGSIPMFDASTGCRTHGLVEVEFLDLVVVRHSGFGDPQNAGSSTGFFGSLIPDVLLLIGFYYHWIWLLKVPGYPKLLFLSEWW